MPLDTRQLRLFALLFLSVIIALSAIWFFILRTEYVPIYENIRESDASQIVGELDASGIVYRLENEGHDILVSKSEASDARVAVAGADIPLGGTTGFELFNESDLGMTEFAQKINLQRAIQGELARTIMLIQGVEFARVHLALPERTLFRSERQATTAAVSIEMRPNAQLSERTVVGIRQLVASSVPGLKSDDVTVIDELGGVVSATVSGSSENQTSIQSERSAIEKLLEIRTQEAIALRLPQQPFELDITVFGEQTLDPFLSLESSLEKEQTQTRMLLDERNIRAELRTPQALETGERAAVQEVLTQVLGLSIGDGDALTFRTGPLGIASSSSATLPSQTADLSFKQQLTKAPSPKLYSGFETASISPLWVLAPIILLMFGLIAFRWKRDLSRDEALAFAELLRDSSPDIEVI